MYSNEEIKWFSQSLITYKDKVYGSDGYIRISISTNTTDYKFFNPPLLNISISNNFQKSCNINFQNAVDLYKSFKKVIPHLNGNDEVDIQRRYQKDINLHFSFKVEKNNNERIVIIELRSSESDYTRIIVPLKIVFEGIATITRLFTETYMELCNKLLIQSINNKTTEIINQLPNLIKGISGQIVSKIPAREDEDNVPEGIEEEAKKTEATIADLDKFMVEEKDKIIVPELEQETKEAITEVKSLLIEKFIENDLSIFEDILNNYSMNPCPLILLKDAIKDSIKSEIEDESFDLLTGVSEDDLKSLVYIPKIIYSVCHQNYINTNTPLPYTVSAFKYKIDNVKKDNLELAYDFLLINLYTRLLRRRLESKKEDIYKNKSLFYLQVRCFTDPFTFSFLEKTNVKNIPSIIATRFKYYESIGVFDKYTKLLEDSLCPEITVNDIVSSVEEACDKIIGKSVFVEDLHKEAFKDGKVRVESKNRLNLEQIINEVLPLEIAEKTGKEINNELINSMFNGKGVSPEVKLIFTNKEKDKKTTKRKKQEITNLERIIKFFIDKNEVPERYQEDFMKYIQEVGNNKIDLKNINFPIDEFGDNIIKILYLWDPDNDPSITKNYKHFFSKVENEIMERDLILAKLKVEDKKTDDSWDCLNV